MPYSYGESRFEQLNTLIDNYPGEFIGIRATPAYTKALHAYNALVDDYDHYSGWSRLWDTWLWFSTSFTSRNRLLKCNTELENLMSSRGHPLINQYFPGIAQHILSISLICIGAIVAMIFSPLSPALCLGLIPLGTFGYIYATQAVSKDIGSFTASAATKTRFSEKCRKILPPYDVFLNNKHASRATFFPTLWATIKFLFNPYFFVIFMLPTLPLWATLILIFNPVNLVALIAALPSLVMSSLTDIGKKVGDDGELAGSGLIARFLKAVTGFLAAVLRFPYHILRVFIELPFDLIEWFVTRSPILGWAISKFSYSNNMPEWRTKDIEALIGRSISPLSSSDSDETERFRKQISSDFSPAIHKKSNPSIKNALVKNMKKLFMIAEHQEVSVGQLSEERVIELLKSIHTSGLQSHRESLNYLIISGLSKDKNFLEHYWALQGKIANNKPYTRIVSALLATFYFEDIKVLARIASQKQFKDTKRAEILIQGLSNLYLMTELTMPEKQDVLLRVQQYVLACHNRIYCR